MDHVSTLKINTIYYGDLHIMYNGKKIILKEVVYKHTGSEYYRYHVMQKYRIKGSVKVHGIDNFITLSNAITY